MKSFKKYAPFALLLGALTVEAQNAPPATQSVSAAEMRVRTEAIDKEIEADQRHVIHLQALARKEKDVIKLTCVNDKLIQIKAHINLFDTASLQLESAISANDDSPKAIFADIEKAAADIKKLVEEANGCAGELEMYKQESKSDVDRPELPDDPTDTGGDFDNDELEPEIEVPGYATPFK